MKIQLDDLRWRESKRVRICQFLTDNNIDPANTSGVGFIEVDEQARTITTEQFDLNTEGRRVLTSSGTEVLRHTVTVPLVSDVPEDLR
jgi:hypothetical protein